MKNQRIITLPDDHRVLQFRPRDAADLPSDPDDARPSATILPFRRAVTQVEQIEEVSVSDEAPGDFRHRMLTNIVALALTIGLTVTGIWLATSIADMRRTQDCVLMGRHDCAAIAAPR